MFVKILGTSLPLRLGQLRSICPLSEGGKKSSIDGSMFTKKPNIGITDNFYHNFIIK